jgi:lipopolysaccharide heptosyltransferase II
MALTTVPREPVVDAEAWSRARRVLCVRPDGLGDVLMTGPAIRALAASGPAYRAVTVLASRAGAAAARMLDGVDDVIEYEPPWAASAATPREQDDLAIVDTLRDRRFDGAVIFTVNTQSALPAAMVARLAGIPRRLAHNRENPYRLLTDWIPEPEPGDATRHEVERQLALVEAVGARRRGDHLHVRLDDHARMWARCALVGAGVDPDGRWLAIHPGAAAASRRYPATGFAEAADELAARGWRIVLTGARDDAEQVRLTADAMSATPAIVLGQPLDAFAAVLAAAPVLVTNNTGPAHLAAAVGTPVVDLYALTNPQHAPWGVPNRLLFHDVPCRNCYRSVCPLGHHLCLRGVPPSAIVDAVEALVPVGESMPPAAGVLPETRDAGAGVVV